METKKWWMFSWLTDTGRFKDDEFQDDLDKLRDYYREHGYLDVEIPEEKIVFSYPKKEGLVITITVHRGAPVPDRRNQHHAATSSIRPRS